MAKLLANLIQAGLRSIDDVPARLRDDVIQILKESGYDVE